jgi:tetratricopeptide (TPR) repeat protein
MLTPVDAGMGLGMGVIRAANHTYFSHSGGNPGLSSLMMGDLDTGDGFAVAVNRNSLIVNEVQNGVAKAYDWPGLAPLSFASAKDLDARLRSLRPDRPSEMPPGDALSEGNLNSLGYTLIQEGQPADAIIVLRAVADVFPQSANACDSLGEAYAASGDTKGALEQYRLALDRLAKYPEPNRDYERNRAAAEEKIRGLEQKLKR